nr:MAG TPA: hypothetical protein [Caudoviricetes sp.]
MEGTVINKIIINYQNTAGMSSHTVTLPVIEALLTNVS